ncbi:unnamed protein product [Soboliphyme baturini]|uniref:Glyco_transf_7N domain-containing protein n=1 Tax=Soboliphyme baturini TaxID=241478 RepID=A0A183IH60_9BILA|nr:unnamed protein product [Soboliphyme baturini]
MPEKKHLMNGYEAVKKPMTETTRECFLTRLFFRTIYGSRDWLYQLKGVDVTARSGGRRVWLLFIFLTVFGLVLLLAQQLSLVSRTWFFTYALSSHQFNTTIVTTNDTASKMAPVNGSCAEPSTEIGYRIDAHTSHPPTFAELEKQFNMLDAGGRFTPRSCMPVHTVAIVVPYRDRESHLRSFLQNIHPFLMNQSLDYGIFIVEPIENETFNRGKLMNVGFVEAKKMFNWSCVIFHDIDLIPEDSRNAYTCNSAPHHFSVAVDKLNYR